MPCGSTISIRLVPMKASVTATFSAPKNSGRVLGSAIFQNTVTWLAPSERRMSRYSGSSVERPIEMLTAMGKKEIMNAIRMVFMSCWPTKRSAMTGTTVAFGTALKPTRSG